MINPYFWNVEKLNSRNYIALFLYALLTVGAFIVVYSTQQQLDYSECAKCDAHKYSMITDYFNGDTAEYAIAFPFNTRIVVPYLVSLLSFHQDVMGYHFINLLFCVLSVVVLYLLWTKLALSTTMKILGFFWLLFHWSGMIRLNVFDPIAVDVPLYFFHALLLLILYTKNYKWLPVIAVVATAQKESFPAYILVSTLFAILYNRFYEQHFPLRPFIIALVLSFATKFVLVYFFPPLEEGRGAFISVLFYVKNALIDPIIIVKWIVAMFVAYGSFLLLGVKKTKHDTDTKPEEKLLLTLVVVSLLLGIIAGGDHTRIVFLGFPFVMTWLLIRMNDKPLIVTFLVLLLSLPVMHILQEIPEPAYATHTHSWFPEYATESTVAIWGVYMIICCVATLKLEKWLG